MTLATRHFIFGAGGMGREVAWLAREVIGDQVPLTFLVDDAAYLAPPQGGVDVRMVQDLEAGDTGSYVVALGDGRMRERGARACEAAGLRPTALIHPGVLHSEFVTFGDGSVVCAGTILTTNVRLGAHVQVNLACTIGHDVVIEDFVTLSPGVNVSGHVTLRRGAFVGTGATIIEGSAAEPLVIGEGAVIAAGACVIRSVEAGALVAGVPAVRKR